MTNELEWRRSCSPNIHAISWQNACISDTNYLIKSLFTKNSYEFMITNCSVLWYENITDQNIKKRCKVLKYMKDIYR